MTAGRTLGDDSGDEGVTTSHTAARAAPGRWAKRFAEATAAIRGRALDDDVVERCFSIAGHRLRVRIAGRALAGAMTRALAHLADEQGAGARAALTVCIWDGESTGAGDPPALVPQPPERRSPDAPGSMQLVRDDTTIGLYQPTERILSMLDRAHDEAICWVGEAKTLPYWEHGAPLRHLLHWWMSERGLQLTHAACIGNDRGGVLLVGRGGSGKSTTALASLRAGLDYVGDDYLLVQVGSGVIAHSLYNTAKLHQDQAERFPDLIDRPIAYAESGQEKVLAFMHERYPARTVPRLDVLGVLLPTVVGTGPTRLEQVSRAEALAAIAPSTVMQLPGAGRDAMAVMATVLRTVPCHRLLLGPDLRQVTETIRTYIDERAP